MKLTISQNTDAFKYMSYTILLFFFKPSVRNNESALVKPVKK